MSLMPHSRQNSSQHADRTEKQVVILPDGVCQWDFFDAARQASTGTVNQCIQAAFVVKYGGNSRCTTFLIKDIKLDGLDHTMQFGIKLGLYQFLADGARCCEDGNALSG
jgi:hypothetical protein